MNPYERLVEAMRDSGKYYNAAPPMLGVMGKNGTIKLDNMIIDPDDYLMDCNLRLSSSPKVLIHKEPVPSGEYVTDTQHNETLEDYKDNVLQEGDQVLIVKLTNTERFVLIAKVVSPA